MERRADLGAFARRAVDPALVERPGDGVRQSQIGLDPLQGIGQLRRDQPQALGIRRSVGASAIARQIDAPACDQSRIGDRCAQHGREFTDARNQGILGALDGIEPVE